MKALRTIVAAIAASVLCITLISCNRPMTGDSINLQLAPDDAGKSTSVNTDFSEEDCIVLRCSAFSINEHEIVAEVSKSKDLKATALVFVKTEKSSLIDEYVQIAVATIIGKEYEYNIKEAKLYQVTPTSAEAAVNTYGIPYSDWQAGAVNDSEKFPCCE
jgi:hypothetical protein